MNRQKRDTRSLSTPQLPSLRLPLPPSPTPSTLHPLFPSAGFNPLCLALKVLPYISVLLFGFGRGRSSSDHSGLGSCGGSSGGSPPRPSRLALTWRWVARDNFGIVLHLGHIAAYLMQVSE